MLLIPTFIFGRVYSHTIQKKENSKTNGEEEKKIKSRLETTTNQIEKKNDFDSFSGHLLFFMHLEMFANLSENGNNKNK